MKKICCILIAAFLSPGICHGAEMTIRCVLMGPTINWDYITLVDHEFTADADSISVETPKPGTTGCVPQHVNSVRKQDSQKFSSLKMTFGACFGIPHFFEGSARFGEHELQLSAPLSAFGAGSPHALTTIYSLRGDELIKTPQGELSAIWLQCRTNTSETKNK